jgi:hypothetical protein
MVAEEPITLPEHYERHLGSIARGWHDEEQKHGIQIVSFENQPEVGVNTFATLGLSQYAFKQTTKPEIAQELLISVSNKFSADAIAGFLISLSEYVVRRDKALLRGEVIGRDNPIVAKSMLTAIYVTNPSMFDKSLTEFASALRPTVFAYLVPITSGEAALVRELGWRWFEEQLRIQNPDICDFSRTEEVLRR